MVRNIELVLKGYGTVEIESSEIDDFGLEVKYSISDITDISKRKSNASKSFNIIGSPKNNKLFKHIYDVNFNSDTFDLNAKQECFIMVNKNIILDGYLYIKNLTQTYVSNNNEIMYNITVYGEVGDIFTTLGNKRLIDLDFSEAFTFQGTSYPVGNHTYNITNLAASQTRAKTFSNIYDYCLINWNYEGASEGVDFPANTLELSMFYPSLYVKAVIDRIFYEAGFTYDSDFFNGFVLDGMFQSLGTIYNGNTMMSDEVFIYNGAAPSTDYVNKIDEISTFPTDSQYQINQIEVIKIDETENVGAGFSITIKSAADYNLHVEYEVDPATLPPDTTADVYHYSQSIYSELVITKEGEEYYTESLWNFGGSKTGIIDINDDFDIGDTLSFYIKTGFYRREQIKPPKVFWNGMTLNATIDVTLNLTRDLGVDENDDPIPTKVDTEINIAEFLPLELSQADFLRSLINQFNLYLYPDRINQKDLSIEPRNIFYGQGTVLDWTEKVDETSFTIEPLGSKINRYYDFKMAKIDTFKTNTYFDRWNSDYGNKEVDVENVEFTGTNNIESKFGGYDYKFYDLVENIFIPNFTKELTDTLATQKRTIAPCIGFIKNVLTAPNEWRLYGYIPSILDWNTINHVEILGAEDNKYDLNFETKQGTSGYVNSYDNFWESDITNLFDNNNRLVTYNVDLNIEDIVNLNFKNPIIIKGELYYLQDVITDITGKLKSKITLIKAFDYVEYFSPFENNFIYGLYDVGSVLAAGSGRPTINTALLDSGFSININTENPIQIPIESNTNQYVWFATPTASMLNLRNVWVVDADNTGSIGGAINLGSNLFPEAITFDYNGVEYYVYIANYQTSIINPIVKY